MGNGTLLSKNYIIIWIVNFAIVICAFPSMTILPLYISGEVTANTTLLGVIIGVFSASALLARFVAGWALDNYRILSIYKASVLIFGLFWFVYPFPQSSWVFFVLRALHGFAFGFTTIAGSAAIVRIIPVDRRGEGFGYFSISLSVGMALGPFIALALVDAFSFHAYFVFLGGWIMVVLGLLCLVRIPHVPPKEVKPFSLKAIFLKKGFMIMTAVFLVNTVYAGIATFAAMYVLDLNLNDRLPAVFFLIMAFSMLGTRLFSGRILDRRGPFGITLAGMFFLGLGTLTMALAQNAAMYLLGGVGVGFGVGILFPVFQTMMNNLVRYEQQGVANATYYVGLDLGWLAGSALAGAVVSVSSIAGSYMFNFGLCILSLILFLAVILRQYNRDKIM